MLPIFAGTKPIPLTTMIDPKTDVCSDKSFKEILSKVEKGCLPCLIGYTFNMVQAAEFKEAVIRAQDMYFKGVVDAHTINTGRPKC